MRSSLGAARAGFFRRCKAWRAAPLNYPPLRHKSR